MGACERKNLILMDSRIPMVRSVFRIRILIRSECSPDSIGSLDPDSFPDTKAKMPRKTKRNCIFKSCMFSKGWMPWIGLLPSYVLKFFHATSIADPDLDGIRIQEGKNDPQK
jgi:hypothetical protein